MNYLYFCSTSDFYKYDFHQSWGSLVSNINYIGQMLVEENKMTKNVTTQKWKMVSEKHKLLVIDQLTNYCWQNWHVPSNHITLNAHINFTNCGCLMVQLDTNTNESNTKNRKKNVIMRETEIKDLRRRVQWGIPLLQDRLSRTRGRPGRRSRSTNLTRGRPSSRYTSKNHRVSWQLLGQPGKLERTALIIQQVYELTHSKIRPSSSTRDAAPGSTDRSTANRSASAGSLVSVHRSSKEEKRCAGAYAVVNGSNATK